jgi:hypothetical protein
VLRGCRVSAAQEAAARAAFAQQAEGRHRCMLLPDGEGADEMSGLCIYDLAEAAAAAARPAWADATGVDAESGRLTFG